MSESVSREATNSGPESGLLPTRRGFLGGLLALAAAVALPFKKIAERPIETIRRIRTSDYVRSGRQYVLGFEHVEVEPGETIELTVRPHLNFAPDRLIVPSYLAENFTILDIIIDREKQFTSTAEVPACIFAENGFVPVLFMRPCPAGNPITIKVRNISRQPAAFVAAMAGECLEPANHEGPTRPGMTPAYV
jgi:hypothetical protein